MVSEAAAVMEVGRNDGSSAELKVEVLVRTAQGRRQITKKRRSLLNPELDPAG